MKMLISVLLCTITVLSLVGCGSTKSKETANSKIDTASVSNSNSPQNNKTKDEEYGKIIFEDEYAKITYTGIDRDNTDGPEISLVIENKCDQDLMIQTEDVLVDDYSVEPIFSCDVLSGKKVKHDMILYKVDKNFESIQGKFIIIPKDKFGTHLKEGPFSMKFNSSVKKDTKEENKVIFENEYAKITYTGIERDSYGGPDINIKIENKSSQALTIQATDVLIDGYMVNPKFSSDILPSKKIKAEISFIGENVSRNFKSLEGKFRITPHDKSAELLKEEPFRINY